MLAKCSAKDSLILINYLITKTQFNLKIFTNNFIQTFYKNINKIRLFQRKTENITHNNQYVKNENLF